MSAARQGIPLPASTRANMSAAQKGRFISPEHRAKISAANVGRAISPEWRAKISAALVGRGKPDGFGEAMLGNTHMRDAPVKGECVYCFGPAQTHDHVIPRGRPGWDDPENVVLACFSCNASKRERTPEEWLEGKRLSDHRKNPAPIE